MPGTTKLIALAGLLLLIASRSATAADEQTVLVVEGKTLPRVKVGDLVRLSASGAAGRTNITIEIAGGAKLISTTKVRKFVDGKPLIGSDTKEFLIQATQKGPTLIGVTTKDTVDRTSKKQDYELDVD
jgi:hypothetical protein